MGARPARQRVSDADLLHAYAETGSVHKVGERFGIRGTSAHERLVKLGVAKPINVFTDAERDRLRKEYWLAAETGKLAELAASMGRTKQFICRQANTLGLTKADRKKVYLSTWKYVSEPDARIIWEQFKASGRNVSEFCSHRKYDKLGFYKCMRGHFPDEWEHVVESKQIKQTKYKFGRQFEYRVRDHLISLGYFAMRSPGSRTPIDIIGIRVGAVVLIQCKRNGVLGPSDWNKLFDLAVSCGATPVLASCPTGRGCKYQLMTDRKDGGKRQPLQDWDPA